MWQHSRNIITDRRQIRFWHGWRSWETASSTTAIYGPSSDFSIGFFVEQVTPLLGRECTWRFTTERSVNQRVHEHLVGASPSHPSMLRQSRWFSSCSFVLVFVTLRVVPGHSKDQNDKIQADRSFLFPNSIYRLRDFGGAPEMIFRLSYRSPGFVSIVACYIGIYDYNRPTVVPGRHSPEGHSPTR